MVGVVRIASSLGLLFPGMTVPREAKIVNSSILTDSGISGKFARTHMRLGVICSFVSRS
jgi:hypothetical protein